MDNRVRIRRGIFDRLLEADVEDVSEFTNMLLYLWLDGKVHIGDAAPPSAPTPQRTPTPSAIHQDEASEATMALNALLEDDW